MLRSFGCTWLKSPIHITNLKALEALRSYTTVITRQWVNSRNDAFFQKTQTFNSSIPSSQIFLHKFWSVFKIIHIRLILPLVYKLS